VADRSVGAPAENNVVTNKSQAEFVCERCLHGRFAGAAAR
jgi:hypothetical protein